MLKTILNSIILLLLVVLVLFFPARQASANVTCVPDMTSYVLNLGHLYIDSQVIVPGEILSTNEITASIFCSQPGRYQQANPITNSGWGASGMTINVDGIECAVIDRNTNISDLGLGLVWTNYNASTGTYACMSNALLGSEIRRGLTQGTTRLRDKVYIVKTNDSFVYGQTREVSHTTTIVEALSDRVPLGELYHIVFSGTMEVISRACTVATYISVDMKTLSSSVFRGTGSTGPDIPFSIDLENCTATTQADFYFSPSYGFADGSNGVVALNNNDGAAGGVGVQLLMNGNPVTEAAANTIEITQSNHSIPFIARYYQTENHVTPGNADTTVVFNIIYQ